MKKILALILFIVVPALGQIQAQVVINEILYHAPEDLVDLQYIELLNAGNQPVDLQGWTFSKGVDYRFEETTLLEPGGFLVLCKNAADFQEYYARKPYAEFEKSLSNSGERVVLSDDRGKVEDSVRYDDKAPWPVSADGYSASLERICPYASGEDPNNWAASALADDQDQPAGSPGEANSAYSKELPPVIQEIDFFPKWPQPEEEILVEATIPESDTIERIELLYRLARPGEEGEETTLLMKQRARGRYSAGIPGQTSGTLVRFRVRAISSSGATRIMPHPNDLRPAHSAYVASPPEIGKIPVAFVLNIGKEEFDTAKQRGNEPGSPGFAPPPPMGGFDAPPPMQGFGGPGNRSDQGIPPDRERRPENPMASGNGPMPDRRPGFGGFFPFMGEEQTQPLPPQGRSAFVLYDENDGTKQLFDFINITPRKGGIKVRFHKDHTLGPMTTANIISEYNERFALAESLAYDLYHLAGNAACLSDFVRLTIDGNEQGYQLLFEQPNKAFLRRNDIDDNGDLFKLQWMGRGIVGQHEKKTNIHTGHARLEDLIQKLESQQGEELWSLIQEKFNVDQVATYFAVNMLLSHWDGFFNNHFIYEDIEGSGKWEIYPWDQDKTWGFYDGLPQDGLFIDMPLTMGMAGDTPPSGGFFGGMPGPGGGGAFWWRPGGYFSKPLLANPQFRKVFLKKTKALAEDVFTKENFGPKLDALESLLADEVRRKARISGQDPEAAYDRFLINLDSIRRNLIGRRQFILEQDEIKSLE